MHNPFLSYAIALLMGMWGCTQKNASEASKNPRSVDFEQSFTITSAYDALSEMLTVAIVLKPGFHAYGPGEKIGRPVNVTIVEENGWKAKGSTIIPGGTKKGESVLLDGSFELKMPVKQGVGVSKGTVFLQICTDTACDRPRKHEIEIRSKP